MFKKLRENKAFKIIVGILKTIVYIVIGLYLLLLIMQKVSDNASLAGFRVFTVASNSMSPVYVGGDVLLVREVNESDIKVGDVISYRGEEGDMKGRIITHRVIEINDGKIALQGDANTGKDPDITFEQVYGKVIYKTVLITLISNIVSNKFGFFFLIFVPIVVLVFFEIIDIIKGSKDEE